jgi:hypothetical protein
MHRSIARIEAFTLEPIGKPAIRVTCEKRLIPNPGQAVMALMSGTDQSLRHVLFPVQVCTEGFITDKVPDPGWRLGDNLDLLGPIGTGFSPPPSARRWLLAALGQYPGRLLPLIDLGLAWGAALSLYVDQPLPGLQPQVEITTDLPEALQWADYLAIDVAPEELSKLRLQFGLSPDDHISIPAQALMSIAMPCGIGTCQACAVKARRGWKLSCHDGPVFSLGALEW